MRRLPVYIVIDISSSMRGEPIAAVNNGIDSLVQSLCCDPYALETTCISIITYSTEAKQIVPLTEVYKFQKPEIIANGQSALGAALKLLCEKIDQEVRLSTPDQKGDWMPLLFLMTDGKPSDSQLYKEMIPEVKKRHFASIIACAAGMNAKTEPLKELTNEVYSLDTVDSTAFKKFFKWVSDSIGVGNRSIGAAEDLVLPPPPAEVNVII